MAARFVSTEPAHCLALAKTMRAADLQECAASGQPDALEAVVTACLASPWRWTLMAGNEVAAIAGVTGELEPGKHSLWMLTSDAVERNKVSFFRETKLLLLLLNQEFGCLANMVDARNTASIEWLQRLGVSLGPAVPHGPYNMPFRPFALLKGALSCASPSQ